MLPQKPFYLIRHGQSEANAAHITAGGGTDSQLTAKGQKQPQDLSPFLPSLDIQPDVIYHSPMIRAKNTATYLNKSLNLEMHEKHDLHEHHMGDWEGLPWVDVQPQLDSHTSPPNGESRQQFAQRIQSVFTDILNECGDKIPMMVAHGGLFFAMGTLYEYGMSDVQNCHLHLFEPEGAWDDFPWRVTAFDIDTETEDPKEAKLVKRAAPFCLSHAMAKIA